MLGERTLEAGNNQCWEFSLSWLHEHAYVPYLVSLIQARFLHCRAKTAVQLPDYHYAQYCTEILSHDKDYIKVKLYENTAERSFMLPSQAE